jgi:hypothetical protein
MYNPSNSWQNNIHNNIGRYLKFRNCLKFYVTYFFSPFWTKHTHKKTNAHWDKTYSQHTSPNLGLQVGLLKVKKEKTICWSITYLSTYPPLYFVTCYSQTRIPPQRSILFWQQKWSNLMLVILSLELLWRLWRWNKPSSFEPTFCPLPSP